MFKKTWGDKCPIHQFHDLRTLISWLKFVKRLGNQLKNVDENIKKFEVAYHILLLSLHLFLLQPFFFYCKKNISWSQHESRVYYLTYDLPPSTTYLLFKNLTHIRQIHVGGPKKIIFSTCMGIEFILNWMKSLKNFSIIIK